MTWLLLAGVAVTLAYGARRLAPARVGRRAAVAWAAAGVVWSGVGLAAGWSQGREECVDMLCPGPLITPETEIAMLQRLFPVGAIRTSPCDDRYICHDWAFAQMGNDTRRDPYNLLAEGYEAVTDPRPGDLIVYHRAGGWLVHSGVVRAVWEPNMVLIESKIGTLGRYLHLADMPDYSEFFTYYRRKGARPETPAPLGTAPGAQ